MEAAPPCSVLLGFPLRGSTAFKDSSASVWSPNFSRSFPSPTWTSWLNLSICSQVTWNCFFLCVLCFLKCLIMSCSGSSSVTYDRKIWSPVQAAVIPQIPKDVAPKVHFFLFLSLFFFFFARNYCVSVIYSSFFTVQSVKMSKKNKYQCYSS